MAENTNHEQIEQDVVEKCIEAFDGLDFTISTMEGEVLYHGEE